MPTLIPTCMIPLGRRLLAAVGLGWACLGAAQTTLSPDRVTFYTEPNFRGEALTIEAGANLETLDRVKRSDQKPWTYGISSVRVDARLASWQNNAPATRNSVFSMYSLSAAVFDLR